MKPVTRSDKREIPKNPQRTIRELGGEIWSELEQRIGSLGGTGKVDWKAIETVTEIVMGVLARYADHRIVNDRDFPVEPLK